MAGFTKLPLKQGEIFQRAMPLLTGGKEEESKTRAGLGGERLFSAPGRSHAQNKSPMYTNNIGELPGQNNAGEVYNDTVTHSYLPPLIAAYVFQHGNFPSFMGVLLRSD